MQRISVTFDTSQRERSPLKEVASQNVPHSDVTFDTTQRERSPLKEVAEWNISCSRSERQRWRWCGGGVLEAWYE